MKEQRTRKRLLPSIVAALGAVVLSTGLIMSAGAAGTDLTSKAEWLAETAKIASVADKSTWWVEFGTGNGAQDYLYFDDSYALREFSFNGSTWLKPTFIDLSTYKADGVTVDVADFAYRADITKQIKNDKGTNETPLVIYVRRASTDPIGATKDGFLPVANVGKQAVDGVAVQPNTDNAGTVNIPVSRDAAPKIAASFKVEKLTGEAKTNLTDSIDGISAVKRADIAGQKDVTFNAQDNSAYIKAGDKDRIYYFWTPDAVEPITATVASTATDYVVAELGDLITSDTAVKISVAYQEKELSTVFATGTDAYGPMSKVATLSVGAKAAAPKITIDWVNGAFKGTKLGMEYMTFTPAGEGAGAMPATWNEDGAVIEANMPISKDLSDKATHIAFRTSATYNKRASAWKVLEIPTVGAAPDQFTTTTIDGKAYLKLELKKYDGDGSAITGYAVLTKDGVGAGVVGKSKAAGGDNGTASMLPYAYGGNALNGFQYRVVIPGTPGTPEIPAVEAVEAKAAVEDNPATADIDETAAAVEAVEGRAAVEAVPGTPDTVIKKWTNITFKPMDGGDGADYAVLDITGEKFTGTTEEPYMLQVRVKADSSAKGTDTVQFVPSDYITIDPKPGFVAVSDLTLTSATTAEEDATVVLAATVTPNDATYKVIEWSIVTEGTTATGAAIGTGNKLTVTGAGKVVVQAKIDKGTSLTASFTKTFTITFGEEATGDVAVTGITGAPTEGIKGQPLTLIATVAPENATKQTIAWTLKDTTSSTAVIEEGKLTSSVTGDVIVVATIAGGGADGADFTAEFTINIKESGSTGGGDAHVAVSDITNGPALNIAPNTEINLSGATVDPSTATVTTIEWSVVTEGTTATHAGITDKKITPTTEGKLILLATVTGGGATAEDDFTKTYEITVATPFVAATGLTGAPTTGTAGGAVELGGISVDPSGASQEITFSLTDESKATLAGTTLTLKAEATGTVTVTATVKNGKTADTDEVFTFDITITGASE
ncbi:MAG: Ig-like domain-containing protein [Ruminococcus sp.]|jgi:hypothetical protein|nr:Ig-like domain-containing protein [Ruminococcus sp.]